jgi:hypothetical protein
LQGTSCCTLQIAQSPNGNEQGDKTVLKGAYLSPAFSVANKNGSTSAQEEEIVFILYVKQKPINLVREQYEYEVMENQGIILQDPEEMKIFYVFYKCLFIKHCH